MKGIEESRREFITRLARLGVGATLPLAWKVLSEAEAVAGVARNFSAAAEYYTREGVDSIRCGLCPHSELLNPGQRGRCRVRQNINGTLRTHAWNCPCVLNIDPIERNPACHVLPGRFVLAIAHAGCNLRCLYCQNWEFSQKSPCETRNIDFNRRRAFNLAIAKGIAGLTFTYTEGTSHIEFNKRLATAARHVGLKTFLCTNGFVNRKPLEDFLEHLDGVTVTFKGFTDAFYRKVVGGRLAPVLGTLEFLKAEKKWVEVATLVVPDMNDSGRELRGIAEWIVSHLGPFTPWHLERFVPKYKLANLPPTPVRIMEKARRIGMECGLKYVYLSNIAPHEGNHTYCHSCGRPIIKRVGFKVISNQMSGQRCGFCKTVIPGIWS